MKGLGLLLGCLLCIFKKGLQFNGWSIKVPSDATGEIGKSVVLPCTFTHPHKTFDRTLTAIWRIKEPYNGTVVFKCVAHSSSELCKTATSYKNKYKLLGNPRHNNLSIKIDNLTWSDSNRYFCRVEFSGDLHDKYEGRTGIRLHLIAAPRIINITVSSNEDHTFKARCTADGEPLPSLTWTGPLSSNSSSVTSMNHQITKELHHLTHDGKYVCTAANSHGRAEGAVYFYKFKGANSNSILILICIALGVKALMLLAIAGIGLLWKGDCFSGPGSLSRQPIQDSTYENLDRRNNGGGSQSLPTH
ncbi:sialic acid-binding Ig-like lectin 15 [Alligator mississippiensis]|uniref:Sialic acid-binding Ig-like lectin 15 n=1 Tax=Alligator mississippiensis TaxID=8496 RepID=A0A151MWH5_ALLMI|nr:sialic acid-binding Ig-like lectin 15 [Alligator mississippiensis]